MIDRLLKFYAPKARGWLFFWQLGISGFILLFVSCHVSAANLGSYDFMLSRTVLASSLLTIRPTV